MTGITETYEKELWEELNALLADTVPQGAGPEAAQRSMVLAAMGQDSEIQDLYEQVRMVARIEAGYLRERMEEDNPVSTIRQRLRLPVKDGQKA